MSESTRTLVIVNPAAARARRAWPDIRAALHESGLRFEIYETKHAGDATTRTREALREGYSTIAVVGGDGSLSEAAAGFFDFGEVDSESNSLSLPRAINHDAALAVLPSGTGDDFARGLAGRREPVSEWVKRLTAHCRSRGQSTTRLLDVIAGTIVEKRERFICLNVSTIGLGAEVARRVAAQNGLTQRLPGEARFVSAAVAALVAWRERRMRVTTNAGEPTECVSNLIAVANNPYAGGGMMFAPGALPDDGVLDVLLACNVTRATIIRELPRIRRGLHVSNPRVKIIKTERLEIVPVTPDDVLPVEADGQLRGYTPAEFRIMPAALRVVFTENNS